MKVLSPILLIGSISLTVLGAPKWAEELVQKLADENQQTQLTALGEIKSRMSEIQNDRQLQVLFRSRILAVLTEESRRFHVPELSRRIGNTALDLLLLLATQETRESLVDLYLRVSLGTAHSPAELGDIAEFLKKQERQEIVSLIKSDIERGGNVLRAWHALNFLVSHLEIKDEFVVEILEQTLNSKLIVAVGVAGKSAFVLDLVEGVGTNKIALALESSLRDADISQKLRRAGSFYDWLDVLVNIHPNSKSLEPWLKQVQAPSSKYSFNANIALFVGDPQERIRRARVAASKNEKLDRSADAISIQRAWGALAILEQTRLARPAPHPEIQGIPKNWHPVRTAGEEPWFQAIVTGIQKLGSEEREIILDRIQLLPDRERRKVILSRLETANDGSLFDEIKSNAQCAKALERIAKSLR